MYKKKFSFTYNQLTYHYRIHLFIGMSPDEAGKKLDSKVSSMLKRCFLEDNHVRNFISERYDSTIWRDHDIAIFLGRVEDTDEWRGEFIHELRHVVDNIAQACLLTDESEACAYLSEELFLELSKGIEKVGKKKKWFRKKK